MNQKAPSKPAPEGKRKSTAPVAPGAEPHHDAAVATRIARDAFSRERYEFLLRTLFALLGLLGLSLSANVYLGTRETKFRYFAVDPLGGIREVVPLERPIQSQSEVLTWSTDAVTRAFTLSFANYQSQLNEYRLNFTDAGWQSYQDALKRQKVIETITGQQFVTSAVPTGAPVVVSQGIGEGGRYSWRVSFPILVAYESASVRQNQSMTVEAVVVRRPESENPRGLGISQIIAR